MTRTAVAEIFDEQRFSDLLDLAGPHQGLELVLRLDEDLSGLAAALPTLARTADLIGLRQHSHVLLAIAGTVGANRLSDLARHLNVQVRAAEVGSIADLLAEITLLLDQLLARIRAARAALSSPA